MDDSKVGSEWIKTSEVCKMLGIGEWKARKLAVDGHIGVLQVPNSTHFRYRRSDVEALLQASIRPATAKLEHRALATA